MLRITLFVINPFCLSLKIEPIQPGFVGEELLQSAKTISAESRVMMIEPYWKRGRSGKERNPCQTRSALFIVKGRRNVKIYRPNAACRPVSSDRRN
jgi:hypothetical protein